MLHISIHGRVEDCKPLLSKLLSSTRESAPYYLSDSFMLIRWRPSTPYRHLPPAKPSPGPGLDTQTKRLHLKYRIQLHSEEAAINNTCFLLEG